MLPLCPLSNTGEPMTSLTLFPFILPIVLVITGALVTLIFEPLLRGEAKHSILPWLAAAFLVMAGVALAMSPTGHFQSVYAMDQARLWLCEAIIVASICSIAGMQVSLGRDRFPGGEPYHLALVATAGAMLMVMAVDWLGLFLALEITSLPIYALVGLRRHRSDSSESLFKYFIMGSVFSAILLYGIAMTYGATGSTAFGSGIVAGREVTFWTGQAFLLIGLLFKVGAVPFHFWVADAYTGAPVAVTGLMSAIVKVGGFAALGAWWLNVLTSVSGTVQPGTVLDLSHAITISNAVHTSKGMPQLGSLQTIVLIVALLSLFLGNFGALKQTQVRRLLAYSAIAHTGYMLLAFGLPLGESVSLSSLWFYLAAYAVAGAGTLAAVSMISGKDDQGDNVTSLAGQGRARPFLGVVLTIFLASMAGIPVTIGFLGKFMVLMELVSKGHAAIAVVAVVMAVVGAVYYLRLVVTLWAVPREPAAGGPNVLGTWSLLAAAIIVVVMVAWPSIMVGAAS